jgi:ATP-dependent Clp protease adaptor protein ClpS
MNKEKKQVQVDVAEETADNKKIILYNDEENTFDHVIESLMKICEHDWIQAEQCTLLVHLKGKCDVKTGTFEALKPKYEALSEKGLTVEIQ